MHNFNAYQCVYGETLHLNKWWKDIRWLRLPDQSTEVVNTIKEPALVGQSPTYGPSSRILTASEFHQIANKHLLLKLDHHGDVKPPGTLRITSLTSITDLPFPPVLFRGSRRSIEEQQPQCIQVKQMQHPVKVYVEPRLVQVKQAYWVWTH